MKIPRVHLTAAQATAIAAALPSIGSLLVAFGLLEGHQAAALVGAIVAILGIAFPAQQALANDRNTAAVQRALGERDDAKPAERTIGAALAMADKLRNIRRR